MKGSALILLIILAAFLWGYNRDTINGWLTRKPQAAAPAASAVAAPSPFAAAEPPPVAPGDPAQQALNAYRKLGEAAPKTPARPPEGTLKQTLDSIQPGGVTNDQIVRRNAYFEKLSQQLKELRGEAPPAATPVPAPGESTAPPPNPPTDSPNTAPAEIITETTAVPPPEAPPAESPPPAEVRPREPVLEDEAAELQQEIDDLISEGR